VSAALIVVAGVVVASRADAEEPNSDSLFLSRCVTQTQRSPEDVIPKRAADADPIRVTIVDGETRL
jgi:hypothetical protein